VARLVADPPVRDDGTVARNARFLIVLDAYPDPDSTVYGPVTLRSGKSNFDIAVSVDLVGRAVVVKPRSLLTPSLQYELVADGLRSLDGRQQATAFASPIVAGADVADLPPATLVTWWQDVQPILGPCAPVCHSPVGLAGVRRTPTRLLDLTGDPADSSYGLIGVPSVGLSGTAAPLLRVAPFDAARSVLLRKLIGGNPQASSTDPPYPNMRVDGQRMPVNLDGSAAAPLASDALRLIESWIDSGAPLGPRP
jgi:hypothetical protein